MLYTIKEFRTKKKYIYIYITNSKKRDLCRNLFKKMKILPFYSQYIFSLLLYTVNNIHSFITNMDFHNYSNRNNSNVHPPITNNLKKDLIILE
jgi:hypothetical protein